jgi:Tol biopolymer transport system component
MIGQTISHYRIVEKLGSGGMGVVYKAEDTRLDRTVALKFLAPHLLESEEHKHRFLREAKAAAALDDPNICVVHEVGEADGHVFLAMGYIDGPEVRAKITERPLKLDEALDIAIQAAQGLRVAHRKGVVHRDIKSSNLMLTLGGQVKIMDFGLAQLTGGTRLTKTDTILGTPAYMSPEQAQRHPTDSRTDIWSLGVVLYEMVTGRLPFEGDREAAVLYGIIHEQHEPLTAIRAGLPLELDRILSKALAKKASERYQHVDDMLVDLRALRANLASGLLATRPGYVARAIAGLVLMAAIAGVVWWLARLTMPKPAPLLTRLTFDSGLTTDPALSPDGKLVAYASDRSGDDNLDIWRQQIGTAEAIRLTNDPADESEPDFSPDGTRIAFRSERDGGGIYVISAFGGGEPRVIAKEGRRPRFSPDGAYIAYWVGNWYLGKAFVVPLNGGTPIAIQPEFASVRDPVWSTDGKKLLILAARDLRDFPDPFDWWVAPREGGPPVKTEAFSIFRRQRGWPFPLLVTPAGWIRDQVFFSATVDGLSSLWQLAVPATTAKASGPPQRLTSGTTLEAKPSVNAGGDIAFASLTANLNIWALPIDAIRGIPNGDLQKATHGAYDAHTSLSADGRRLVFISTRSGNPDVWMKDLSTGNETALTATPSHEEQPEITPDGTRVCYVVFERGKPNDIYEMNVNGGPPEKLCDAQMNMRECVRPWDWSPDGTKLLYLLGEGRGNRPEDLTTAFGLVDVATRQKSVYLESPRYFLARPRFSPDGQWISFTAFESFGFTQIMTAPFGAMGPSGDQWTAITDATTYNDKPRWSPDGSLLYFTSERDGYRCIYGRRLDPRTKRPAGEAFDVYHSHNARLSLINVPFHLQEISLSRDKMFFNLGETTGNIWMTRLYTEK